MLKVRIARAISMIWLVLAREHGKVRSWSCSPANVCCDDVSSHRTRRQLSVNLGAMAKNTISSLYI
jgi:hypothetical protein